MTNLSKLSGSQLSKMLENTKAELKRRENIQAASLEINAILKKYGVTMQEIDLGLVKKSKTAGAGKKPARKPKAKDQRAKVEPKFKDPDGDGVWSGRGRAPMWVADVCARESIDVEAFKLDPRFTIK